MFIIFIIFVILGIVIYKLVKSVKSNKELNKKLNNKLSERLPTHYKTKLKNVEIWEEAVLEDEATLNKTKEMLAWAMEDLAATKIEEDDEKNNLKKYTNQL